ncbi:nitroreductase family protein [Shouchella lehensis]|uniref:Putative NAD(P)H nitroreductase n=2 Tax=Shouchella lehensis TaxID=300825 RepID=A0A060M0X5_9BACI|nr:nitroreductase [Shouchella lehensis]AIC95680.1 NAD(P)H nitroreductase [Shouchella lehensis G1]TES51424.1 nitroreductase [Shouchella lehensis]
MMTNRLTTIDSIIKGRRSIKKFKSDAVSIDEIVSLLEVAKWAPNHKLTEPWRFILFAEEGKEAFIDAYKKSQLGADQTLPEKAKKKAAYFNQIPLHLVVVMPEHPRQKTWDEDYGAVSAMIQNFQLAAWARGIGMIWRTNDWIYDPVFREAIGVESGEKIIGTLMIGYADFVPEAKERTSIKDKLTIVTTN